MEPKTEERLSFQAEVSRLLDIVANSLYSNKEIFLRELISNASDACDRLRYLALTEPGLLDGDPDFKIRLSRDAKARTLTIADNGIGMNRDDLIENLGTIARSGTAAFVQHLQAEGGDKPGSKAGDKNGDGSGDTAGAKGAASGLIGQFGVGFYSAFMVAESVEVTSRKAGEDHAWTWVSDGKGDYTVAPAAEGAPARGTRIVLKMKPDAADFLDPARLRKIVKTYSDHVAIPVVLEDGDKDEALNAASAIWTRPKSEITDQQYTEFYHHVAHAFDDPWLRLHFKVEGVMAYSGLLYVPASKPFDLFHPERRHGVKLYVKRVFITDDCAELIPPYLRFLRGVIDTEDLALNISREMLQNHPTLAKIRAAVTKRVLGELKKKAEKAPEEFATFWAEFGAVVKEGLYEDAGQRDTLIALARFASTKGEGVTGLADYVERMPEGQSAIYYIAGDDAESVRRSPHLEGFKAKGVEVLLLSDPVDEFWVPAVAEYKDKPFKSVTRGGAELSAIAAKGTEQDGAEKAGDKAGDMAPPPGTDALIAYLKLALKEAVKDVRASERLTDSPVCLIADEGDMDMHLERLLKQHRQIDMASKRVLEINPGHSLIRGLAERLEAKGAAGADNAVLEDAAWLLLDQARILEGEALPDPAAFARRLTAVVERGFRA